jgi:hypothetical protein
MTTQPCLHEFSVSSPKYESRNLTNLEERDLKYGNDVFRKADSHTSMSSGPSAKNQSRLDAWR